MSRAGQGNEVGSVFRCAVATYLAVHGLRSHPVPGLELPDEVHPTGLDFETADPTDDIRVTFTDGRRGFISAKRKLTRGRPLRETVDGWVRQVPLLGPHDLLIVAAEEFPGPLGKLDAVLRRSRTGQSLDTRAEVEALAAVTNLIDDPAVAHTVLERARVIALPGSTSGGYAQSHLAALMDFVVEDSHGATAVTQLWSLFHQQAGQALGSGIDQWVQAVESSGLRMFRDSGGPAGARAAARLAADAAYRERVAAGRGRIDLTLLATDLPPVVVDDLLDAVSVKGEADRTGTKLMWKVRRWRRLLLVGQPGTGKSVALREVAAHCAGHPHGPLPLRIHLPMLIRDPAAQVTVDVLIDIATRDTVPADLQQALVAHARNEVAAGRAIFLFDSLDECGTGAAQVAQALAEVQHALHPRTGFVVSTRASGERAAGRLDLPTVELEPPKDLGNTIDRVLVACADARVADAQRAGWLAARRTWMSEAQRHHGQLLSVPLLAILVALICAETPDAGLPKGRAALLHEAIKQAVERWERDRASAKTGPWAPGLTSGQLLDGYVVLGRLLEGGAAPHERAACDAVVAQLTDPHQWAMSPAAAKEVAHDIVRFWDEHVAVFVLDADGVVSSRSKVFSEIATAMWSLTASDQQLMEWLGKAVDFVDSDGAIALAADLNPDVVPALVVLGDSKPQSAVLVATLATTGTVSLTSGQASACLAQLTALVRAAQEHGAGLGRPRKGAPEGDIRDLLSRTGARNVWDIVELVCALPLHGENIERRTALLNLAALSGPATTIAGALAAMTDAATEQRQLTEAELDDVRAVLELPLPDEHHATKRTRRGLSIMPGGGLTPGVGAVASAAVQHLEQLPVTAPALIFQIAMKGPMSASGPVFKALEAIGFDTSDKHAWSVLPGLKGWLSSYQKLKQEVLSTIASLDLASAHEEGRDEANWSLSEVGDLLKALGWDGMGSDLRGGGLDGDNVDLRRRFVDAVADAFGIEKVEAARQARYLLSQSSDAPGPDGPDADGWFVASCEPMWSLELVEGVGEVLSAQQHLTLLTCLESESSSFADTSAFILANVEDPTWDSVELFTKALPDRSRHRVTTVRVVAIFTAGDLGGQLLDRARTSQDPDYRIAARRVVILAPELDPDGSVLASLCRDPDLSVRPKYGGDTEPRATCWSCERCRTVNDIDVEDCVGCDVGVRPTRGESTSEGDE